MVVFGVLLIVVCTVTILLHMGHVRRPTPPDPDVDNKYKSVNHHSAGTESAPKAHAQFLFFLEEESRLRASSRAMEL